MSTTFPRVPRSRLGYDVEQVEDFLEEAKRAFDAESGEHPAVTAEQIRHTAFAMHKGGYSTQQVDEALERLEDAFSGREREREVQERGDEAWYSTARTTVQEILARLARPAGARFTRVGFMSSGYDRKDVDRFAERLSEFFEDGRLMTVDEVRTAAFRSRRRGYREAQVDLVLDSVVDVMLAVRS